MARNKAYLDASASNTAFMEEKLKSSVHLRPDLDVGFINRSNIVEKGYKTEIGYMLNSTESTSAACIRAELGVPIVYGLRPRGFEAICHNGA